MSTIIALSCVDKWGRRKFLVTGASLMGIGVLLLGFLTHLDQHTMRIDPCEEDISCYHNSLILNQSSSDSIHYLSHHNNINISNKHPDHHNSLPMIHPTLLPEFDNTGMNSTILNGTDHHHSEEPVHGATPGKVVAFLALMMYVAAFGFSFGPGLYKSQIKLCLIVVFPNLIFYTLLNVYKIWGRGGGVI